MGLGDTLVESRYSDYKDFGGVQFPSHIVRSQGGYPVLDINVSAVKANPAVDIAVPHHAGRSAHRHWQTGSRQIAGPTRIRVKVQCFCLDLFSFIY
ncbi:hypothetical protein [Methylobacter svalbardensis]|uniref:hypothetical protein n=1 Tax=Methylobacter svalbardensis TaxID=3080016 RepID=UPI0030EC5DCF